MQLNYYLVVLLELGHKYLHERFNFIPRMTHLGDLFRLISFSLIVYLFLQIYCLF